MAESPDDIDWSLTTWEGSRREQLRRWSELTFDEILEAQEEMGDHARAAIERRREQGLPYIDPFTRQLVPGSAVVHEEPPAPECPGDAIPAEWREEFEAAARRPLAQRMRYAFIQTYKPVLDDAPFRAWESTAAYRDWCEHNLPHWLGYGRV